MTKGTALRMCFRLGAMVDVLGEKLGEIVGISRKTMSIALLVIGVVLAAYLTLLMIMSPDVSARGEDSKIEASDGEISQAEISNGKDSNGEILRKDGDVIRKEQFKRN